jgi:hypothetical protein
MSPKPDAAMRWLPAILAADVAGYSRPMGLTICSGQRMTGMGQEEPFPNAELSDREGSEDDIRRESEFLFRCYSDPIMHVIPRKLRIFQHDSDESPGRARVKRVERRRRG